MVRYEDLYMNLDAEMRRILEFVHLPVEEYDFKTAGRLPVRGSSMVDRASSGRVHWAPEKKTAEFQPLARWRHWPRFRHERFNWIAASYLEAFGYEPVRFGAPRAVWVVLNAVLDVRWWLALAPRAAVRKLPEYLRLVIPQWAGMSRRTRGAWGRMPPGTG